MEHENGFTPEGADEFEASTNEQLSQPTSVEKSSSWNTKRLINKIGLSASLALGLFASGQRAEAASPPPASQPATTERTGTGRAEQLINISEYLTTPMFIKACTPEGSVQILKDLYGGYISQEKTRTGAATAEYNREVNPQDAQRILNTRVGELITKSEEFDAKKYDQVDTGAYAQDLMKRIQERYGKSARGEALSKYYNLIQERLFPNGFEGDPGVIYQAGKNKVFMPAFMMNNQEILNIISSAMVESGADKQITGEKDLNERSVLTKIAIDNGMGLVTQGAVKNYVETFGGSK